MSLGLRLVVRVGWAIARHGTARMQGCILSRSPSSAPARCSTPWRSYGRYLVTVPVRVPVAVHLCLGRVGQGY